ncbi:hypothetical protein Aperf_G00000009749 [Anoplocephala perfoliata]
MALKEVSSAKCFEGYQKVFQHDSVSTNCSMKFGLTSNEQNFIVKSGAQRYASKLGLILVNPDTGPRNCDIPGADDPFVFGAGASFYVNATKEPWKKNYRMYDYVTKELPELIEKNFNVIPGKYGLAGHSNPVVIRLYTGYLDADVDWTVYDTVELLRKHKKRFAIPPLIDQGDADEFLPKDLMLEDLINACTEVGQEIKLRYQKGYEHSYYFVSTFIEEHLEFHARNLSKF